MLSTAKRQQYLEIQGGPIGDQSIKLELHAKETRWHTEYWFPTDKVLDIYQLKVPSVALRSIKDIPLFQWARPEAVSPWIALAKAYEHKTALPTLPGTIENNWPPSGMENLNEPFKWAIKTGGVNADQWRYYYGAWLAGRGMIDESIKELSVTKEGLAKVLLARLLKQKGDTKGARAAFDAIKEPWLQIHPQVIVDRDKVLRSLGSQTIPEREGWLSKVAALNDEWIIERKVQLLIDKNEPQAAKTLLLSVPFQKVHQTCTRTNLWVQICKQLNVPFLPIPERLGEDQLARFGAYREYE
jgi:hypothetical protein